MLHGWKWSLYVLILDLQKIVARFIEESQHLIFLMLLEERGSDTHKELCLEYERIQCFLVQFLFSKYV